MSELAAVFTIPRTPRSPVDRGAASAGVWLWTPAWKLDHMLSSKEKYSRRVCLCCISACGLIQMCCFSSRPASSQEKKTKQNKNWAPEPDKDIQLAGAWKSTATSHFVSWHIVMEEHRNLIASNSLCSVCTNFPVGISNIQTQNWSLPPPPFCFLNLVTKLGDKQRDFFPPLFY